MKKFRYLFVTGLFTLVVAIGCSPREESQSVVPNDQPQFNLAEARANYSVMNYFTQDEIDTLMLNIVTYIGKRNPNSDQNTRFLPEFRPHFLSQVPRYDFVYYHIGPDSTHYYYIRRPARSLEGDMRGAGGKFRLGPDLEISGFAEVFITPILDTPQLYIAGFELFREMIDSGNVDRFLDDPLRIEWPDDRLRYDTLTKEWRYIRDL